MLTSDRTIRWIENLADQERSIKSGERTSLDLCNTKDEVLSVETSSFITDLFHHFEYLVKLFNLRVEKEELQIKLTRDEVSSYPAFSSLRNNLKMVITAPQPGRIQLQCQKLIKAGPSMPPKSSMMFSGVIEARFGRFHDVEWFFLRTRVTAEQVSRHYLTEFIQVSRQAEH